MFLKAHPGECPNMLRKHLI